MAFVCTWAQDERPADLHMAQPNVPVSKTGQFCVQKSSSMTRLLGQRVCRHALISSIRFLKYKADMPAWLPRVGAVHAILRCFRGFVMLDGNCRL
jgi:hypothetical protein